jgi:hypothetical protein
MWAELFEKIHHTWSAPKRARCGQPFSRLRKRSQSPAVIGDGRWGPCSRNGERVTMLPCLARSTAEYTGRIDS